MTGWRARWEKTSAELTESRAECMRLREALDDLNEQTEGLFNAASRSDHVRAMVHTIRMQWARIRELKNEARERDVTEQIDHAAEAREREATGLLELDAVTRVEVITGRRDYVRRFTEPGATLAVQDDGRTLKVFINMGDEDDEQ